VQAPYWKVVFHHFLHLVILLLPSLLLRSIDWQTIGFASGIALFGVIEFTLATRGDDKISPQTRDPSAVALARIVGAGMLVAFWLAQCEHIVQASASTWTTAMGAILMLSGIALRGLAIHTLGTKFVTDIRLDDAPIRSGIYRFVDHPSEYGLLAILCGAPLILGATLTALGAIACFGPISVWRIHRENCLMKAQRRA